MGLRTSASGLLQAVFVCGLYLSAGLSAPYAHSASLAYNDDPSNNITASSPQVTNASTLNNVPTLNNGTRLDNAPAVAEPTAQDVLLKVAQAVNTLNYEASLVVFRPGSEPVPYIWRHGNMPESAFLALDTTQAINTQKNNSQSADKQTELTTEAQLNTTVEYLNSLNGPGAQVVRVGNKVSFFEADKPAFALQQSHIHGPIPHNLIRNPEAIFAAYDVVLVGKSRVTGKAALHFRVLSKDGSRYSYALWVDSETHLPLKLNTLTLKGEVLEQVQVTNLVITDTVHPDFLKLEAQQLPQVRHINPPKEFALKWSITSLPVGMIEVKRDIHRLAITGELVEYKLLSDGLIDVSIYLQRAGTVPQDDVLIRNQSETFLSRVRDGLQLTVVGKIPAPTANKIMEMIALSSS